MPVRGCQGCEHAAVTPQCVEVDMDIEVGVEGKVERKARGGRGRGGAGGRPRGGELRGGSGEGQVEVDLFSSALLRVARSIVGRPCVRSGRSHIRPNACNSDESITDAERTD